MYFYRCRRVNGRRVTEYVGPGEVGRQAEQEDAERRVRRQAEKEAARAERQQLVADLSVFKQLQDEADLLTRSVLLTAGFHQHDRGRWRRRLNAKTE